LPVGVVMQLAQRLYEGVELRGERRALLTHNLGRSRVISGHLR